MKNGENEWKWMKMSNFFFLGIRSAGARKWVEMNENEWKLMEMPENDEEWRKVEKLRISMKTQEIKNSSENWSKIKNWKKPAAHRLFRPKFGRKSWFWVCWIILFDFLENCYFLVFWRENWKLYCQYGHEFTWIFMKFIKQVKHAWNLSVLVRIWWDQVQ